MAERFKNRYGVQSARMPKWDYGTDAAYFITICVNDRLHEFGEIVDEKLKSTPLGSIAEARWLEIPTHFPYGRLDVHVIMPNHMHGILIIDKKSLLPLVAETPIIASPPRDGISHSGGITGNMNPMLQENLSRIIRWYKGRCTFEMRKINPGFKWQSRFYDRIIRNGTEYERIRNYILNNPANWKQDKFF